MSKRSRATAFLCLGLFASAGANHNNNRLIDAMVAADLVIPANGRALVGWDDSCQDDANYLSPHFAASCVFHKVVDCKGFTKVGYTDDEVYDLITHCPRSCNVPCGTWTKSPTPSPTSSPTVTHSDVPSSTPSSYPTSSPSSSPTAEPSRSPSQSPTTQPSLAPSLAPSHMPTSSPSASPTSQPSNSPSAGPTSQPSDVPTDRPSQGPSATPSSSPSAAPTVRPTSSPSSSPSSTPTSRPSTSPTGRPSSSPSDVPTFAPSSPPTVTASESPSAMPTISQLPSALPTTMPSVSPSTAPSRSPIIVPVSSRVFEMSLSPVSSYLDTVAYAKFNEEINDMIMGNIILPDNLGSQSRSKMEMSTILRYQNLASYRVLLGEEDGAEGEGRRRRLKSFELIMSIQKTIHVPVPVLDIPRADGLDYDPSLIPDSQAIDDAIEHLFLDQFQQLALKLRLRVSRNPMLSQVNEIEFHGFQTLAPTASPSARPSEQPSTAPTESPTHQPSSEPSSLPTSAPSLTPSSVPTFGPSSYPTLTPTALPSAFPTVTSSTPPSASPTATASAVPTALPTTNKPSSRPSASPTSSPTLAASSSPSNSPSSSPSVTASQQPSETSSDMPSLSPSVPPKEILAFGTSFDFHFDGVTSYLDQTSFDAFNEAMNDVVLKQLQTEMYVPAEVERFEISFTFFYQILGGKQIHNLVESPVKRARNLRTKKSKSTSISMENDMIEADNRIGSDGVEEESPGYLMVRMQMVAHFYVDSSVDERSFVRPEKNMLDDALSSVLDGGSMRLVVTRLRQTGASQYRRLKQISLVGFNFPPTDVPTESPTSASPTVTRSSHPSMHPTTASPSATQTNRPTKAANGSTVSPVASVPSMQPSHSPVKEISAPSSEPSIGDTVAQDTAETQLGGWKDSCQDDPSYVSTIIPNAACENFREVDCFAFLSIGVSLETVSELVNSCPRSCNVECGRFTVFGVATGAESREQSLKDRIPTSKPSTLRPTFDETAAPTSEPSESPSGEPSSSPTSMPTSSPSVTPTGTSSPTESSSTSQPISVAVVVDNGMPSTTKPSVEPSGEPSGEPSDEPSDEPSVTPSSAPITSMPTVAPSTISPTSMPSLPPTTVSPTSAPTQTEISADDIAGDDIAGDSIEGAGETDGKGKGKKSDKNSAHKKSKKSSTKASNSDDVGKGDFIVAGATAATSGSQIGPKMNEKKGNGVMVGFVILLVIGLSVIGAIYAKKRWIDADDNDMDDRNTFQLAGVIETRHNESRSTVSDLSIVNEEQSSNIKSKLSNLFTSRSKAESEIILPEPSGEGEEVMLEDIIAIGSISVDSADEKV